MPIEQIGKYPSGKKNVKRGIFVDIQHSDGIECTDFKRKYYDKLKDLKKLRLDLHKGHFGYVVFEDPEDVK